MSGFLSGQSGGLTNQLKAVAGALLIQQLLKHAGGGSAQASGTQSGGLGGLLGGLLGGGASSPKAGGLASGSLGGLLGGLLGGNSSPMASGPAGGLGGMLDGEAGGNVGGLLGGLGRLLGGLRSQGLGQQVDSWTSHGPNQQISAQDLESSFDPQDLDEAARHVGTDRSSVLNEVSRMLPQLVDQATPQGSLPQHEGELGEGGFGGLLGKLLGDGVGQR